jgi:hypothetical protein
VQRLSGLRSHTAPADAAGDPSYRLVSIAATRAPGGCTGSDWLVYRIAQGDNLITGYRRGDLPTVTIAVEQIVRVLNERRVWAKSATRSKHAQSAAPPAPSDEPSDPPAKSA